MSLDDFVMLQDNKANCANEFMTSFFLWFLFQVSVLFVLLIPTFYPHLRPRTSNPITHYFVRTHWIRIFIYTDSGWTPRWLNPSLSWIELFAERSGKGADLTDVSCLSQGENCFCSHNSHNTAPFLDSLYVPLRGIYEEEVTDSDDSLLSLFVCVCNFFCCKEKVFLGLMRPAVHLVLTKLYVFAFGSLLAPSSILTLDYCYITSQ